MLHNYSMYDSDLTRRIYRWMPILWGRPYSEQFQCAHPWVHMMNSLYNKGLSRMTGVESHFLADWWFRQTTPEPIGRDPICFRFQQELTAVSPLRPNGITHIELLIAYDHAAKSGICLGVGLPSGDHPLNGTFGLHPFGVNMPGDGWIDEDQTHRVMHGYIDIEKFSA